MLLTLLKFTTLLFVVNVIAKFQCENVYNIYVFKVSTDYKTTFMYTNTRSK